MIDIPANGHYIQNINNKKYICFKSVIGSTFPVVLKIKKIEYQVFNDGKLFHKGNWKGVMVLDEANLRSNIYLTYGPLESHFDTQLLQKGWTLSGKATIECPFGAFEKTFESQILEIFSMYPVKDY